MCIILTEEDLFKKHAKKVPFFCPFSNLPQKCCPAAVQGTFKNDSKYHICPYNSNTRPGFRVHKKIWGSRTLSSTLLHSLQNKHLNPEEEAQRSCVKFQSTLLLDTESSNAKSSSCPFTFYLCCLPHQEYNYNVHSKIVMEIQWM